jgi:hypothetical protein
MLFCVINDATMLLPISSNSDNIRFEFDNDTDSPNKFCKPELDDYGGATNFVKTKTKKTLSFRSK